DADGQPLTYEWNPGDALDDPSAVTPAGWFGLGLHAVQLIVADPLGWWDASTATFWVVDSTPPVVRAEAHLMDMCSGWVVFDASASTDACGDIEYTWIVDDAMVGMGATYEVELAPGRHGAVVEACDTSGNCAHGLAVAVVPADCP
ncbi:MAG: hypothetical protein KC583_03140, partial [Myxococcales bacterium]|nr:hypothetical protein [Myxococcales bacterium]